jgi:hypothetical protein
MAWLAGERSIDRRRSEISSGTARHGPEVGTGRMRLNQPDKEEPLLETPRRSESPVSQI